MTVEVVDPFGVAGDPDLPWLTLALDPVETNCLLAGLAPALGATAVHLTAIRVVRHKKGRRCLVQYDVAIERAGAGTEIVSLLGKTRAKGLDHAAYHLLNELWCNEFGDRSLDGISVPQPMGVIPELRMWLQRKVHGIPAGRLVTGLGGQPVARRIADAAHKLHRIALNLSSRRHTIDDELGILRDRLGQVAAEKPYWSRRIESLLMTADRYRSELPAGPTVGVHRDFHPDQVLIDGERLYLLDFDLFCQGDGALDVGNFAAHLIEQALRVTGNANGLAAQEQALVERYLDLSQATSRASIQCYTDLSLLRHIYLSTRYPERAHTTAALIGLCEQRLASHQC